MNYEELKGVLFPNEKQNERQPDLTGSCAINGKVYRVVAWKRYGSESRKPFLSLAFQEKELKPKAKAPVHTPKQVVNQVSNAFGGPDEIVSETEADIDEVLPF